MALDAVGAADDQNGIVHHLQGPLRLGGKVHVPRGVQQGQLGLRQPQQRLLGKDGDAPGPLQRVGVQKSVPMVHPAQLAQHPRPIEHRLAQGGFARVHMGQYANDQPFHPRLSFLLKIRLPLYRTGAPVVQRRKIRGFPNRAGLWYNRANL